MKSHLTKPALRCAIYTRKSTEEGLEKEFNTLDAQRESGESYIKSQAHEGWVCLPTRYDDGGFTAGNMDRPALRRLIADIDAGKVDVVVVYKVDRLSRSLLDFARLMETFDKRQISLVAVTQHFNTTHSMGRLTLNILLSFAQFEREIISERTRDKIAATRRKGKWAGGHPILGYDIDPNGFKLVVNDDEAARVRAIFDLYLEHQSLLPVVQELELRGCVNKRWTTRRDAERGGKVFTRTSLYKLLTNVAYVGKVRYKSEIHQGEHQGIVDPSVWQRVQSILQRNGRTGGAQVRNRFGALLKGLLRCGACNCAMTPAHTTRGKAKGDRMSATMTYEVDFHIERRGRGRRDLDPGPRPVPADPGRVPRVCRLMALAHRFDGYLRSGKVADQTSLAALGQVSRARISQIMNLLNLAPDIQEAILFLPRTLHGRDAIHLRQLQPIARTLDWKKQRTMWRCLTRDAGSSDRAI